MWGATAYESAYTIMLNLFQFTHPVWGATDGRKQNDRRFYVSIHAPRVGCDGMSDGGVIEVKRFQFTHPVWGATTIPHKTDCLSPRFNSRTPCGVRQRCYGDADSV